MKYIIKNVGNIDFKVFLPATIVMLALAVLLSINPSDGERIFNVLHAYLTHEIGWIFLISTFLVIILCIYLACSKYGLIVLGGIDDKPEFGFYTWMGMIFTSGTGGSLLYLASVEWIWIVQAPPFSIEKESLLAAKWASAYGMFHWGPSAWAWYLVCAIPMAYFLHVKKKNTLKISDMCRSSLGRKADGFIGHAINFLYMFGLLGGVMTSLALGTPLITNALVYGLNLEQSSPTIDIFVIFLWTAIPLFILFLGLKNGVAVVSDWNIRADIAMLACIAICGPSSFILNQSVDGLGLMLQNFLYMSLTTDAIEKGGFPQSWTIFYFSWWIVYALPFGLFIAKISKGRTIKELILCGVCAGSLGCISFYMVLSSFGIYLQIHNVVDLVSIMNNEGRGAVVYAMLEQLPFSKLFIVAFGVITLVSYVTGHCAVGYSLAAATQKQIKNGQDPTFWNIAFWLILAGVVSLLLYFVSPASLKPLQTVSIITGLPLCIVILFVIRSFFKQVKIDAKLGALDEDSIEKTSVSLFR